jgi:hypothetical protein
MQGLERQGIAISCLDNRGGVLLPGRDEVPTTIYHPVLVEAFSPACHAELILVYVRHNQLSDVLQGLAEKAGEFTILFLQQKWTGTCIHPLLYTNLYKK